MWEFIGQRDTVPAAPAATVEELRAQLSLCDGEESDTLLLGLLRQAQGAIEARTQRLLSPRAVLPGRRGGGESSRLSGELHCIGGSECRAGDGGAVVRVRHPAPADASGGRFR